MAVEHPSLVRAVVAVDPAYGFEASFAAGVADGFRGPDPMAVATAVLSAMEGSGEDVPPWLPTWHRRRALGHAPEVVREMFLSIFDTGADKTVRPAADAYLMRRACPVLTVSTPASLKAKGMAEDWDKAVSPHPYSESLVLEDTGHWLFQERPAEFNALVLEWLGGLPVTGGHSAL